MMRKKMIAGLVAALFCVAFVGVFLAQGDERERSELGFAIKRDVHLSPHQLEPNANCEAIAVLTSVDSLENLENEYYYQTNEDKHINDSQIEVATSSKIKSREPCTQVINHQSDNCNCCNRFGC